MNDPSHVILVVFAFLFWDYLRKNKETPQLGTGEIIAKLERIDAKLDELDTVQDKIILREIEPGIFNLELAQESDAHGVVLNDEPLVGTSTAMEAVAAALEEHEPFHGLSDIVPYGGSSGEEIPTGN